MTQAQALFFKLLQKCPSLEPAWNDQKNPLDIELVRNSLGIVIPGERVIFREGLELLNHEECIMLRFFAGLWLGDNQFDFDLLIHMKHLDDKNKAIIQEWINEPFFP